LNFVGLDCFQCATGTASETCPSAPTFEFTPVLWQKIEDPTGGKIMGDAQAQSPSASIDILLVGLGAVGVICEIPII